MGNHKCPCQFIFNSAGFALLPMTAATFTLLCTESELAIIEQLQHDFECGGVGSDISQLGSLRAFV